MTSTAVATRPASVPADTGTGAVSRRRVVARAAAVGGTALLAGPFAAGEAVAAGRFRPARYTATPVAPRFTRHLLNRFSYGMTPALMRRARRAGGPLGWFEQQLEPSSIPDRFADGILDWFPELRSSPQRLWQLHSGGSKPMFEVMADFGRWTLLRRMYSQRQVHEMMTQFWSDLLHIPALTGLESLHRFGYDQTIRKHSLGRFDNLLVDAVTHPAMLIFLNNDLSTASHPNENLGRELLELHTVGRTGGYTEQEVKDSARVLTGWTVDRYGTWQPRYEETEHALGPVKVLGFSDANVFRDGRELTRKYLRYLAHHPATAQRIAHRLATRFIRDNPPAAVVQHLAQVYLDNDTAIKPVLRALVRTAAFRRSVGQKIRTPAEDVVATCRVLGVQFLKPSSSADGANQLIWLCKNLGQRPYGWPRPDGDPDSGEVWASVSRMFGSFRIHWQMSGAWYPTSKVRYRPAAKWVPRYPIRFDYLVDHLSRTLVGQPSSSRLLKAACQATGVGPRERITRDHGLVKWRMPRLLATILDTPAHMTR